jgi:hypothetical protein
MMPALLTQRMQRAAGRNGLRDQALRVVAHIARQGDAAHRPGHALRALGVDIVDQHLPAARGQHLRDALADAGGAPRDQNRLSLHAVSCARMD